MHCRLQIQQDLFQLVALSFLEYHHFLILIQWIQLQENQPDFVTNIKKGCNDSISPTFSAYVEGLLIIPMSLLYF